MGTKTTKNQIVRVLYIAILVLLCFFLVSPFLFPVVFAGTVALALYPLLLHLEVKRFQRKWAAFLLTFIFAVLVSIPFFFFIVKGTVAVTQQLQKFSSDERYRDMGVKTIVSTLKHDVVFNILKYGEKLGVSSFLNEKNVDQYLIKVNAWLLNFFQTIATNLPTLFLFYLVMVWCTYSFLKSASSIRHFFQELLGFDSSRMDQLVQSLILGSRSVYVSNLATSGMQAIIVSTAVSLLGLADFFLVFFVTLILAFIPIVGAAPVAFVFGLVAYLQGSTTNAVILVLVGGLAGIADNFLRPYLATLGQSKLPAIAAFVFVVGGAVLLGFPGLFIGLLVGSFAYDTLPIFWKELAKSESEIPLKYIPETLNPDLNPKIEPRQ